MPRFAPSPNAEAAVNAILKAADIRAYSSSPKRNPEYPHVVTARVGGQPAERHRLDAPRIQCDVWGDLETSKTTVWRTAALAILAINDAEGETVELSDGERVFIAGVDPEMAPSWQPDPRTSRPRYLFALRVYCRQA